MIAVASGAPGERGWRAYLTTDKDEPAEAVVYCLECAERDLSAEDELIRPTIYPNVKNAHIVPRTYLERWAVDGRIGVVQVQENKRLEMAAENVGIRRHFYRRERPDGSDIDDIEWTLSEIESKAAPLLQALEDEWPFSGDDKLVLSRLFAFQWLRTPRWKERYRERTDSFLEDYDANNPTTLSAEDVEQFNEQLRSDTHRLGMMLSTGVTGTAVFASMHWTLVEFERPWIVTSDQPLVLWTGAGAKSPHAEDMTEMGVIDSIEIRLPVSPTAVVLMTWSDAPDDDHVRVAGTRDQAANFSAFTTKAADRQWFHRPDVSPPIASGNLLPVSPQLIPDYTPAGAANSRRRAKTSQIARARIDSDLDFRHQEVEVVTVSRPDR